MAAARPETVVNPAGKNITYAYDTVGNRASLVDPDGGRFDYEYDNTGNRTSVLEVTGDRVTWSYDKTSQLTAEHRSGANAYASTFTYDAAGNRLLKDADSVLTTTLYDAANQIQYSEAAAGRTTYTFDANGNQQVVQEPSGDRVTNTWDYENLATKVEQPASSVSTYTWNGDNHRVAKDVDGTETKMVWDDENILLETDDADATHAIYTLEQQVYGNVISERRKAGATWTPSYYHFDGLGSTRNLTDTSETVSDTWIYDAWGNIVSHSGTSSPPFLWVGEVQYYYDEETGLYNARVRIYDPVVDRWISVDPIGFIDGVNLFLYVLNSPLNVIDPSGLFYGKIGIGTCNTVLKLAMRNSVVRGQLKSLPRKCKAPDIKCEICKGVKAGGYNSATNTIVVCTTIPKNVDDIKDYITDTLIHELIHKSDDCNWPMPDVKKANCNQLLCIEARAYSCSNNCDGKDRVACLNRRLTAVLTLDELSGRKRCPTGVVEQAELIEKVLKTPGCTCPKPCGKGVPKPPKPPKDYDF